MTKTRYVCKRCGVALPDDKARFHVSGDTEGGITGSFCGVKCYLAMRYGADAVEAAYARAFVPVERRHGDADCLQPEEKIAT